MTTTTAARPPADVADEVIEAAVAAMRAGWSPTNVRDARTAWIVEQAAQRMWKPHFPSEFDVAEAAALIEPAVTSGLREGSQSFFTVSPGALQIGTVDRASCHRTDERARQRKHDEADDMAGWIRDDGGLDQVASRLAAGDERTVRVLRGRKPSREITEWSRRSRVNFLKTTSMTGYDKMFTESKRCVACGHLYGVDVDRCPNLVNESRTGSVDGAEVGYTLKVACCERRYTLHEPGLPGMVTVTAPAEWLSVFPEGSAFKDCFRAWRERYRLAWGGDRFQAIWKQEFQDELRAPIEAVRARFDRGDGATLDGVPASELGWPELAELAREEPSAMEGIRLGRPHMHAHTVPPEGLSEGPISLLAGLTWEEIMAISETDPDRLRDCDLGGLEFRVWLSLSWAQVVGHPDGEEFGKHVRAGTGVDRVDVLRSSDPKRLAWYLLKSHSSGGEGGFKEYQHEVPLPWQRPGSGPGRFWGACGGLDKVAVTVDVSDADRVRIGRIMRSWSRLQGAVRWTWTHRRGEQSSIVFPDLVTELTYPREAVVGALTKRKRVKRYKGGKPMSKYPDVMGLAGAQLMASHSARTRWTRERIERCRGNRGWVAVNDGPAFARDIARWLIIAEQTGVQLGVGQRVERLREMEVLPPWWGKSLRRS